MVILKSTKEEIHRLFLLLANTKLAAHILCALQDYYCTKLSYKRKKCRDSPEKNGCHIKSAQMTRLKCL